MGTSITRVTSDQRDLKVVEVTSRSVACDGGGGALGHPLTYYEVGADGTATCNYCDKKFVLSRPTGEAQG
jgi:uncharacterized Zn-finger protein